MDPDPTATPTGGVWMSLAYPLDQSQAHENEVAALRYVNALPTERKPKVVFVYWNESLWCAEQRFNESLVPDA